MSTFGINSVPGVRVGHYTDSDNATGCTVVLCEDGAVGGVDVRGSAPGTLGTDSLNPTALVEQVHAVVLSGGSAFGLNSIAGVVGYLEEKGVGIEFGNATIPIVSGAILFDLGIVRGDVRPGPDEGRAACLAADFRRSGRGQCRGGNWRDSCQAARTRQVPQGRHRDIRARPGRRTHSGRDCRGERRRRGVVDPETSEIVAGPLDDDGTSMLDSMELITAPGFETPQPRAGQNTTIGVVATNAKLTKSQANKLADVSHDGLAMAVRPAHLMSDGDTMFALATGGHEAKPT